MWKYIFRRETNVTKSSSCFRVGINWWRLNGSVVTCDMLMWKALWLGQSEVTKSLELESCSMSGYRAFRSYPTTIFESVLTSVPNCPYQRRDLMNRQTFSSQYSKLRWLLTRPYLSYFRSDFVDSFEHYLSWCCGISSTSSPYSSSVGELRKFIGSSKFPSKSFDFLFVSTFKKYKY